MQLMIKQKILLLEDDILFAQSLCDYLGECGFYIQTASNIEEALEMSYKANYDLYILDINLPDGSGLELLSNLRNGDDSTPAIFLTSYKDKDTLCRGYNSGCDDFLNKPVDLDELLLRIMAIFKRIGTTAKRVTINSTYEYDLLKKSLFHNGEQVILPQKTGILLDILVKSKGELVKKEVIISNLWSAGEEYSEGSIRVYINQLKKLLGENSIKNHKGLGYTFEN
jgi:DNA-binding response OmpR family regulator